MQTLSDIDRYIYLLFDNEIHYGKNHDKWPRISVNHGSCSMVDIYRAALIVRDTERVFVFSNTHESCEYCA